MQAVWVQPWWEFEVWMQTLSLLRCQRSLQRKPFWVQPLWGLQIRMFSRTLLHPQRIRLQRLQRSYCSLNALATGGTGGGECSCGHASHLCSKSLFMCSAGCMSLCVVQLKRLWSVTCWTWSQEYVTLSHVRQGNCVVTILHCCSCKLAMQCEILQK